MELFFPGNANYVNNLLWSDPVSPVSGRAFPGKGRRDDAIEVVVARDPAQQLADPVSVGDQRRWIAGAAGIFADG